MLQGIPSLLVARGIHVPTLVSSYSETNHDSEDQLSSADNQGDAQSFAGLSVNLGSSVFYLQKFGSPTGNVVSKLYNITGTFGSSSKPTGAALATSNNVDPSTFPVDPNFALITFTFSGANQFLMSSGTNYCITVEYSGGNHPNRVNVAVDTTSPTAPGNNAVLVLGGWLAVPTVDVCFYVYST